MVIAAVAVSVVLSGCAGTEAPGPEPTSITVTATATPRATLSSAEVATKAAEDAAAAVASAAAEATKKADADAAVAAAEVAGGTDSQLAALRRAEDGLSFGPAPGWSSTTLIEQLEFEDYSTEDAT